MINKNNNPKNSNMNTKKPLVNDDSKSLIIHSKAADVAESIYQAKHRKDALMFDDNCEIDDNN